jgi:MYXO-CTERM domain-containing protein
MKNTSWKNILRTALLAVTVGALPALAGPDNVGLGTGRDGALTVTTANQIINAYARVTAPLAPGDNAIMVSSATGFAAGDLVLVMQMTGVVPEPPSGGPSPVDLTNDPVGRWEFARLGSVAGNTLNLTAPLVNSYAGNVTQVIRVREHTSVTINAPGSITAPAWDGSTGGVVAFLATGSVALNAFPAINVTGKGFQGGLSVDDTSGITGCTGLDEPAQAGARKGEGIAFTRFGPTQTGRGRVANGGAGGVCLNSGGGGGGNGGTGGQGGNSEDGNRVAGGQGGAALTFNLLNHLLMGGGGGAGHVRTVGAATVTGGAGGGIVFVRANATTGAGTIVANGGTGGSTTTGQDAASGGGGGGSIYVRIAGASTCGNLQAIGGTGGSASAGSAVGPGGGGGGGRVFLQKNSGTCTPTATAVIGASAGVQQDSTVPGGSAYNAQPGTAGSTTVRTPGFPANMPAPVVNTPANGSRTNDTTPTYSGTISVTPALPAGTEVAIFVDGAEVGRVTPDALGNWTFTPVAPLGTGTHSVNAIAINTAEAVQSSTSNTNTFVVDLTPPTVVVATPAEGSRTNDTTPTYSGTVSDDGPGPLTVAIQVDGTPLGNATVTGTTWTLTPLVPLPEGPHTVMATATDDVGNTASDSNDFTVDVTAPTVAVTTPAEGSSTNDTTPTYSGTVEAGATVVITVDGTVLGNATVTGTTWTFTPTVPLAEGPHTVTATASDDAGNTASDSNNFTVDTTAPTVAVTTPAEGSSTNDTTPTYSGTVEAGATVIITVDGVVLGNATVTGTTWTFTPTVPLAEGPHTVMATASDDAGNTASDSNTFTVDLTAPAVAVTTPAEGSSTNDTTPAYSGTVEAGATVVITVDGVVLGNATVTGTTWTFTPTVPLLEGPHTVMATATDDAGNTASDSNDFTVDVTAPTVAVTTPAEGSSTNDTTPTYSGTVEAGATVVITVDGTVLGNATVTGNTWTFTPTVPLAEGPHTVTATATDTAGNSASDSNDFIVDTLAPAVEVTTPAEGSSTNDSTPAYSGTVEAGATVVIMVDGVVLGNATVTGTTWAFTPTVPLAEGSHTVTATATDVAGNSASDSNTFTVDLTAPAVSVTTPAEGSSTNDTTPAYSGTVEAGATVIITVDGVVLGNATVTGTTWTFTPTVPLAEGPHTVMATATDAAGNSASDSNTFTVDTTAPAAPVVNTPADGATLSDNTPTYSGTAEPGSTVTVIVDGAAVGTTTADSSGNWSFTPVTGLTNGEHTVAATATDAAGNVSPQSNTNTFTVDATIPAAPVITGPPNNTVTNDTTPTITGTAPPNSTVTVIIDGNPAGTVTSDAAGNWTFTPTTPLADGPHDFTAVTTNNAGNASSPSNTVRITVDTGAPDTTIVSGPMGTTDSTSATFTFSSNEAGVSYECNLDGAGFQPCTNPVTFEGLSEGEHTLQVRARDGADNVDPTPATVTWTVELPIPETGDRDFLGDGIGCAASGGDPSSLAMMGLGLLAAVLLARRRRQ